jgi:glutaredoxin/glutathione-dependent peroxiredoxin
MIRVGDRLPEGTLHELTVEYTQGCPTGPEAFKVSDLTSGKRIVIFGLPGAFTRTCSGKHLPGFVELADKVKSKKVDEIWCLSVNDAMVMAAWGKDQRVGKKVRMLADGAATFTKALGLEADLTERGFGVRSQRYSMLVEGGVVKSLNVEKPGQFEVSSAEKMLEQL